MIYRDVPSDDFCWLVNDKLWSKFETVFNHQNGFMPRPDWSEAEVVQYLDQQEISSMTKEIFLLDESYLWRSGGTISQMYSVSKDNGDYRPYDGEAMLKDVSFGVSVLVRPASKFEKEWADRKLNHYKASMRSKAKKEFALDD